VSFLHVLPVGNTFPSRGARRLAMARACLQKAQLLMPAGFQAGQFHRNQRNSAPQARRLHSDNWGHEIEWGWRKGGVRNAGWALRRARGSFELRFQSLVKLMLERTRQGRPSRDAPRALRNLYCTMCRLRSASDPFRWRASPRRKKHTTKTHHQNKKALVGICQPGPLVEAGRKARAFQQACGRLVHVRARERFATHALDAGAQRGRDRSPVFMTHRVATRVALVTRMQAECLRMLFHRGAHFMPRTLQVKRNFTLGIATLHFAIP